jgi:hypothetical protein
MMLIEIEMRTGPQKYNDLWVLHGYEVATGRGLLFTCTRREAGEFAAQLMSESARSGTAPEDGPNPWVLIPDDNIKVVSA